MSRLRSFVFALGAIVGGALGKGHRRRIVREGSRQPAAELWLVALLLLSALFAVGFIVVYATDHWPNQTQYEGIALGGSLVFMAAALILLGKRLVVTEELSEDYPAQEHPQDQAAVTPDRARERQPLHAQAPGAGRGGRGRAARSGLAALAPALSLGPALDTDELRWSPWRRGKRLVREDGVPIKAADIEQETFYTAYPEHAIAQRHRGAGGDRAARPERAQAAARARAAGRRSASWPTRRSARTRAARSRSTASRCSRRSSPSRRWCARATTPPSTRRDGGDGAVRPGRPRRCRSCRSRSTATATCARPATSQVPLGRRGGACASGPR